MNKWWSKKKLAVGLLAVAVVALGVGVAIPALAQTRGVLGASANVSCGAYLDTSTLTRLASLLGVTPSALTDELNAGKTLGQIAQEKNVQVATLVDAIVAPYADSIALQVKYGNITQEQSQTLLEAARQRAGLLLTQDLSAAQGYNGRFGICGGNAIGNGYGGGMMGGRGGCYNSTVTPPGSSPAGANGSTLQRNVSRGWGMMGGGMMARW